MSVRTFDMTPDLEKQHNSTHTHTSAGTLYPLVPKSPLKLAAPVAPREPRHVVSGRRGTTPTATDVGASAGGGAHAGGHRRSGLSLALAREWVSQAVSAPWSPQRRRGE